MTLQKLAPPLPLWKKWASYLVDIRLGKASTELNPSLELCWRKGRLYLTTPHAVYSYGDLYDNFTRAFQQLDLDGHRIGEVLVLGFGMGSVPYMLEKVFHKKYCYVGVEADPVIADWATEYLLPLLSSPTLLLHEDALDYVETSTARFDLIVVDLFVDDLVPKQFESPQFLSKLDKILQPNGLLLYNRLTDELEPLRDTRKFFEEKFKPAFPGAYFLDVLGNWILVWKKGA